MPWSPIDLAETLTGLTDCGRIHNRQGLGDVVVQHAVEQGFVAVLQRAEIDVFVEIVMASREFMPAVLGLLFQALHRGRQQAKQTIPAALGIGKGRALGRQCVEKGGLPSPFVSHRWHPFCCNLAARSVFSQFVRHDVPAIVRSARIDHAASNGVRGINAA